jgi:putative methyltransferase (TIGR04325 family)
MIKKFIKQLVPESILKFRSYLKNKYYGYTFWENFNNENDLINRLKGISYLNKKQQSLSLENFLKFDKDKINFSLRNSIIPIFLSGINKENFSILDIGGGFNSCYKYIKFSQNIKFNVVVLELPETVNDINENKKFNKNLIYVSKVPQGKFDIAYFGSSYQYFLNLNNILDILKKTKPEYIVISDTTFTNENFDIFSIQVNMYPSLIPYKINSIIKIKEFFREIDYKIIYQSKRQCGHHKHVCGNKIFNSDLIFAKTNY